jgi:hypothetical protein
MPVPQPAPILIRIQVMVPAGELRRAGPIIEKLLPATPIPPVLLAALPNVEVVSADPWVLRWPIAPGLPDEIELTISIAAG